MPHESNISKYKPGLLSHRISFKEKVRQPKVILKSNHSLSFLKTIIKKRPNADLSKASRLLCPRLQFSDFLSCFAQFCSPIAPNSPLPDPPAAQSPALTSFSSRPPAPTTPPSPCVTLLTNLLLNTQEYSSEYLPLHKGRRANVISFPSAANEEQRMPSDGLVHACSVAQPCSTVSSPYRL